MAKMDGCSEKKDLSEQKMWKVAKKTYINEVGSSFLLHDKGRS